MSGECSDARGLINRLSFVQLTRWKFAVGGCVHWQAVFFWNPVFFSKFLRCSFDLAVKMFVALSAKGNRIYCVGELALMLNDKCVWLNYNMNSSTLMYVCFFFPDICVCSVFALNTVPNLSLKQLPK